MLERLLLRVELPVQFRLEGASAVQAAPGCLNGHSVGRCVRRSRRVLLQRPAVDVAAQIVGVHMASVVGLLRQRVAAGMPPLVAQLQRCVWAESEQK